MRMNNKNIFNGIIFILAAIVIIIGSMGLLGGISFWSLLFTVLFVVLLIKSLYKLKWTGILFSIAFLLIIYNKQLGIENLTPWPVLAAALLGSIGLNMIFHNTNFKFINISPTVNKKQYNFKDLDIDIMIDNIYDDEYSFKCDCVFGSTVKYINCTQLKKAKLENTFGNLVAYFDTANLYNNRAIALIDNTFGKTTLYVPKEWNVCLDIDDSFGQTNEKGRFDPNSIDTLYIKGDNTFGNLEINYV